MHDDIEDIKNFFRIQRELYGPYRPLSAPLVELTAETEGRELERTAMQSEDDLTKSNDLDNYNQEINTCKKCSLSATRKNFVFGIGNPNADLMFVGEAPGHDEDIQGKPFVGRAGLLLNLMLQSIGLRREDVFIANVLKCRPPNNRDPLPDEIEKCEPYLKRQIDLVSPRLLVTLGRFAAASLLRATGALATLREDMHTYDDVPLIVTYHPAALLRNPQLKRQAWEDLKKIKSFLKE
jgi:DNA polymerase